MAVAVQSEARPRSYGVLPRAEAFCPHTCARHAWRCTIGWYVTSLMLVVVMSVTPHWRENEAKVLLLTLCHVSHGFGTAVPCKAYCPSTFSLSLQPLTLSSLPQTPLCPTLLQAAAAAPLWTRLDMCRCHRCR